jgi:hypothetical protein
MSTTPHLLISSFHVSDQLSFISSYYVSISSQPSILNLLCNVYSRHRPQHCFVHFTFQPFGVFFVLNNSSHFFFTAQLRCRPKPQSFRHNTSSHFISIHRYRR